MAVSKEDFIEKINHVSRNIYLSHFHLKIHEKMTQQLNKYQVEDSLSSLPEFFGWSRMAHYDAGILKLTLVYDATGENLGIKKILNIFKSNYQYWNLPQKPDFKQWADDLRLVSREDELVKGLIQIRNKLSSHTDSRLIPMRSKKSLIEIYGGKLIERNGEITTEEIEKLPKIEKTRRKQEISVELHQTIREESKKVLDVKVPSFEDKGFYILTARGIEICNRYRLLLNLPEIELKLDGIED